MVSPNLPLRPSQEILSWKQQWVRHSPGCCPQSHSGESPVGEGSCPVFPDQTSRLCWIFLPPPPSHPPRAWWGTHGALLSAWVFSNPPIPHGATSVFLLTVQGKTSESHSPRPRPALQRHLFLFIRPEAFIPLGAGTGGAWIRPPGLASVHSGPASRQLQLPVPGCACHRCGTAGRLPVPTQPRGRGS